MTIHDEAEKLAKEYDERVRIANGVWRAGLPRTTFGSETQAQHEATATLIRTLSARLKAVEAERDAIERQFSSVSDGYSQLQLNRRTK